MSSLPAPGQKPVNYRMATFTHWANLSAIGAVCLGAMVSDPAWLLALVPTQALVVWVLPDLPWVKKWAEEVHTSSDVLAVREMYLQKLWGVRPKTSPTFAQRIRSVLFTAEPDSKLDHRIADTSSRECQGYLELRQIVERLRELSAVQGAKITEPELVKLEIVINDYLRLLIACQPLEKTLSGINEKKLQRDLADVERRLKEADRGVRMALVERQKLLQAQVEQVPQMQALLELLRTRADGILLQLQHLQTRLLAEPGMGLDSMLEELIQKQDLEADPLALLESDRMVQDFLKGTQQGARQAQASSTTAQ